MTSPRIAIAALPLVLASVLPAIGCRSRSSEPNPSASSAPAPASPLIAERRFHLDVPPGYAPGKPAPLLLALHGYGADGDDVASGRWGVSALALAHGAFVAHPDGTLDASKHRFWNATDACCNFGSMAVDDVAYLSAVIDDVATRYPIDPKRIWVAGISNGGFMAHRLACDRADKIAAIVSLAGSTWADPSRCAPSAPVSVLEVHGTDDPVVPYDGGARLLERNEVPYPSVEATVAASAAHDRCSGALTVLPVQSGFDDERPTIGTEIGRWTGCPPGIDVERWKMPGAKHIPRVTRAWSEAVRAPERPRQFPLRCSPFHRIAMKIRARPLG
jgi:polyhydroxybutyrate depolymerase